jgi:hypothetical protein
VDTYRVDVSPDLWRSDLWVVDTITQPEASARMLGSCVIERGKAGAQQGLTLEPRSCNGAVRL